MISIIIPTYNEEKTIGRTLSDLKSNLTLPYELIVSDDKSTDRTVEIARRYADKVIVPDAKHPTIAANRNAGAKAASGDIMAFMDSDSRAADPDAFFSWALAHFAADPKLVALTGKLRVEPDVETFADKAVYAVFNLVHRVKNNVLHSGEAPGKFQMMRRSAFDEVGGYREDLATREDGIMFNSLSKIGRTLYDPALVVFHGGRRAHAIGWPKLLSIWMAETFWVACFGKTLNKTWTRWWEEPAAKK